MISEDELISYLSGQITGPEKDAFEQRLAQDPAALRILVEQEKLDAALTAMLAPTDRERLKASIMTLVEGPAETELKSRIHEQVEHDTRRDKRSPSSGGGLWDWIKGLPSPVQLAALAALAVGFFFWGQPSGTGRLTKVDPKPDTNSVPPPINLPAKQPRDPVNWPFAASSPWNTPIGSAATYAEPTGIDLAAGIRMYDAYQAHPTLRASASSTTSTLSLYRHNDPTPVASLRYAPSDIPGNTQNFALVAEDGKTLYDLTGARLNGTDIIANQVVVADLTGSGMPGEYNAPTPSGMSDYAGSLCADDFNGPINRVLGAVFHPSILAKKPDGNAHVWPATQTPNNYEARFGALRESGNLHIGTLLAIPRDVDLATIGVGTSGPAYEMARAFQNYGLYLKNPLFGSAQGPLLGMCGDLRSATLPRDFNQQLARVASHLKVVENNGPNSVGGGGTPSQPAAPEFNR